MYCQLSCLITLIFLVSMLYFTLFFDKTKATHKFEKILDENQRKLYRRIANERKTIYYKGYLFGILISIVYLMFLKNNYKNFNRLNLVCVVSAITFITNYFFYILSPKTEWMITHLKTDEQRKEWLEVYKKFSYNYHFGFVIGILLVALLFNSYCLA